MITAKGIINAGSCKGSVGKGGDKQPEKKEPAKPAEKKTSATQKPDPEATNTDSAKG